MSDEFDMEIDRLFERYKNEPRLYLRNALVQVLRATASEWTAKAAKPRDEKIDLAEAAHTREVTLHAVTRRRLQTLMDLFPKCEAMPACQNPATRQDAYTQVSICDSCVGPNDECDLEDLYCAEALRGLR